MLLVWMIGTGIWVAVEMGIGPRLQLDYKYCTNIAMYCLGSAVLCLACRRGGLVQYSPARPLSNCNVIVVGFRIASGLVRLCLDSIFNCPAIRAILMQKFQSHCNPIEIRFGCMGIHI